jgi:hypothetical protein
MTMECAGANRRGLFDHINALSARVRFECNQQAYQAYSRTRMQPVLGWGSAGRFMMRLRDAEHVHDRTRCH